MTKKIYNYLNNDKKYDRDIKKIIILHKTLKSDFIWQLYDSRH